jgi:cytochrome c6
MSKSGFAMANQQALPPTSLARTPFQSDSGDHGEAPQGPPQLHQGATTLVRRIGALLLLLLLGLAVLLWSAPAWGASTDVVLQRGGALFENHCAGCHLNGGNVIRRNKTLKRQDLLREGVKSAADVARIAANGKGQMSGYAKVLGEGGPDAVGAWVWKQAELGWPRR